MDKDGIYKQFMIGCKRASKARNLRRSKYKVFQDALYEKYPKGQKHRLFAANYEGD